MTVPHRHCEPLGEAIQERHARLSPLDWFAALAMTVGMGPALAQELPPAMPTRDVDITYRAGPIEQRWRFRAADHLLRLDPSPGLWMLLDYTGHSLTMVDDGTKVATALPPPAASPFGAKGTKQGTDEIAGLPCTEWEQRDTEGQATLACFTADGVMLRARRGTAVLVQATAIAFRPADPAAFTIPPGYTRRAAK